MNEFDKMDEILGRQVARITKVAILLPPFTPKIGLENPRQRNISQPKILSRRRQGGNVVFFYEQDHFKHADKKTEHHPIQNDLGQWRSGAAANE